jgi:cell wall assembly regulator SMI1
MDDWTAFVDWARSEAPGLVGMLRPPAAAAAVDSIEAAIGKPLPEPVKAMWKACGGQEDPDGAGIAAGFVLLSPEAALAEWRKWDDLRRNEPETSLEELSGPCTSSPRGAIREAYTAAGWLPLWREPMEGNYLGVDLDPGEAGVVGQVIHFGRDEDEKNVLFWDYAGAIRWLAAEAREGRLIAKDGRLAHRDGRVLGVLASLAAAGKIPGPAKPAAAANAQPERVPDPLPAPVQAELEAYVALVVGMLAAAPNLPQERAESHQEVDDARKPAEASVIGSPLVMKPYKPPIDCDARSITGAFKKVLESSLAHGLPLQQIEIQLARTPGGWQPAVAIETAENRKRLVAARKPLDAEIATALASFLDGARGDWEDGGLEWAADPAAKRPGLSVVSPRPRPIVAVDPSPALREVFDRVNELYARFGRVIHTASWNVSRTKPGKVETRFYAG